MAVSDSKMPLLLVKQEANGRVLNRQPAQKLIGLDRQMEELRNEAKERKIKMDKKTRSRGRMEERGEKCQDGDQKGGPVWEEAVG